MRLIFAVCFLLIAYATSYPAFEESATDNDENDFELELRSILNQLDEERMERSLQSDEDESDFSKRAAGGNTVIDKQSECEIKCIYNQRNPKSGKGKTVKAAAKVCKNLCPVSNKKPTNKNTNQQKKAQPNKKLSLRNFIDDNDDSINEEEEEEQQTQRRELYNYLMEQLE